ncbi:hypothetical protein [Azospirillum sp.]|uniref:hypothetical protein n=1 Tax=Azospirillum sp. TaxID=34012 RepID=UPI003D72986A
MARSRSHEMNAELETQGITLSHQVINGKRVIFRVATCTQCQSTEENRFGADFPPDAVIKRFKNSGWTFGKRTLCRSCSTPAAKPRPTVPTHQKDETMTTPHAAKPAPAAKAPPPPAQPLAASPVRTPTIAEVVRIVEKLDMVFSDGRYRNGHSDDTIARELNIPRAVVAKVREESPHHGPIQLDPEVVKLREDVDAFQAMHIEAGKMLDELRGRLVKLEGQR